MTSKAIPRDFGAVPAPNRTGWLAWYQAPNVGTCWLMVEGVVTRERGSRIYKVFETKVQAEIAAARAKDAAEDQRRAPRSRHAKEFIPRGTGRNRRAVSV